MSHRSEYRCIAGLHEERLSLRSLQQQTVIHLDALLRLLSSVRSDLIISLWAIWVQTLIMQGDCDMCLIKHTLQERLSFLEFLEVRHQVSWCTHIICYVFMTKLLHACSPAIVGPVKSTNSGLQQSGCKRNSLVFWKDMKICFEPPRFVPVCAGGTLRNSFQRWFYILLGWYQRVMHWHSCKSPSLTAAFWGIWSSSWYKVYVTSTRFRRWTGIATHGWAVQLMVAWTSSFSDWIQVEITKVAA